MFTKYLCLQYTSELWLARLPLSRLLKVDLTFISHFYLFYFYFSFSIYFLFSKLALGLEVTSRDKGSSWCTYSVRMYDRDEEVMI